MFSLEFYTQLSYQSNVRIKLKCFRHGKSHNIYLLRTTSQKLQDVGRIRDRFKEPKQMKQSCINSRKNKRYHTRKKCNQSILVGPAVNTDN